MIRKAVYTVEAAWVMSLCTTIVMASIMLTFHIYQETLADLQDVNKTVVDAPTRFRQIQLGKEIVEELTEKEK